MRRSFLVWVTILGLPGALACNLLIGNETPDVAREDNAIANDASVSSSSGTLVDPDAPTDDAGPGLSDAGPDATDDHAELPASRLVFVNGNPDTLTGEESLEPRLVQAFVLREDAPAWNAPTPMGGDETKIYVASPAVFFLGGRLYVLGGELADGTDSFAPSFAALSAPILGDVVQPWQPAPAFPTHSGSRCAARVNTALVPAQVDVLCGVRGSADLGVMAYSSEPGDAGLEPWTSEFGLLSADGVVFATPSDMSGLSKGAAPSNFSGRVAWSRAAHFVETARGNGLPELADACAVSFRGQSYLAVVDGAHVQTYRRDDAGNWEHQPRLQILERGLHDLTCTASERGLYLAAANTVVVLGKPTTQSYLYRALVNGAADAGAGAVTSWEQTVQAPPVHDPGSVLIAIPLSASDAGQ